MKLSKDVPSTRPVEGSDVDLVDGLLMPTAKFAAASGGLGFLFGGTLGVLRNSRPVIAGIASSVQCTALGATFSLTRSLILQAVDDGQVQPHTATIASTFSGALSGASVGYAFRGPQNIIPGLLCWSAFGACGQMAVNAWHKPRVRPETNDGFLKRVSKSSWSPVKSMTDLEYADLLREKALKLEVEIAILDDKIAALKQEQTAARDDGKGTE